MSDNVTKSIAQNVSVLAVSRVLTTASSILLMLVLPRFLGDVEYGRFYLGQSLVLMFSLLVDFGGTSSIPKAVARDRRNAGQILADSALLRAGLWALSYAGLVAFGLIAGYPAPVIIVIAILGIAMAAGSLGSVMGGIFQGFEALQYPAFGGIVGTLFTSAVGVAVVVSGGLSISFACVTTVGAMIATVVVGRSIRRIIPVIPRPVASHVPALLREGIPYFFNSVFAVIYYRIDTVMLSLLTTEATVGWYGASYRFFDSLMTIPNILTMALFPVLSRLWGDDRKKFGETAEKSLHLMIMAGAPMAIVTFSFSSNIIDLFFGLAQYSSSVVLLKIFSICMLFVYVDFILASTLLAADRQRSLSYLSFSAIFINVGLNAILIPLAVRQYGNGGVGSAISTGVTELYIMISMLIMLPKGIFHRSGYSILLKTALAAIVSAGTIYALGNSSVPWFLTAIGSVILYVVLLIVQGAFSREEFSLILRIPVLGGLLRRMGLDRFGANE